MDQADTLFDLLKDAPTVVQLLAGIAARHPFLAALILTVIALFVVCQGWETAKSIRKWCRESPRQWVWAAAAGVLFLFVLSWIVLTGLVDSQRPQPVNLQPSTAAIVWGRRLLLTWEAPPSQTDRHQFSVQVRQGDKAASFKADRNQCSFLPLDEDFHEGGFRWRVRSSDPESTWSGWQTATFYKDRLARIIEERVLRVGLYADDLRPYAYSDREAPDGVDGIDVRVARILVEQLAKLQGWPADLSARFERSEWLVGNVEDLRSGKTDIAIALTTRFKERELEYNILFSDPYLRSRLAFAWHKGQQISSLDELANRKVAAWEGSTPHRVLAILNAEPHHYRSTLQMFEALKNGEVDAVLDDENVICCEVQNAAPSEFVMQVFHPPEDMELPFTYPEELAAYVYNDGSATALLEQTNAVFRRPEVQKRLEELVELFVASPGAPPPHEAPSAGPDQQGSS